MKPVKRMPVNKFQSAKKFRKNVSRTKPANLSPVSRGGIRL